VGVGKPQKTRRVVSITVSLGIANGTLSTVGSITLFQGKARGYLVGDKDQYLPIKISWSICYLSQVLLGVILRWSRRPSPELRLELAACRGALLTVVDNHHLQLFPAYVLLWSPKSMIPCPVITSRRADQEGYRDGNLPFT